jgi:hypothetical protein
MPKELDGGVHEKGPEDGEHKVDARDEDCSDCDEDPAQDQRDKDPEGQHALLILGGNREGRHDHNEDEEVVDGQALLYDVAGEVLRAVVPSRDQAERDAEGDRDGDIEDRSQDRLAEAHDVRVGGPRHEQVKGEQRDDRPDRGCPCDEGNIEHQPDHGPVMAPVYPRLSMRGATRTWWVRAPARLSVSPRPTTGHGRRALLQPSHHSPGLPHRLRLVDPQSFRDRAGTVAVQQHREHREIVVRQPLDGRSIRVVRDCGEVFPACGDGSYDIEQDMSRRGLVDDCVGLCGAGGDDEPGAGVRGVDDDGGRDRAALDPEAGREAVVAGESGIENEHVGPATVEPPRESCRVARGGHDLEAGVGGDQAPEARDDRGVVI